MFYIIFGDFLKDLIDFDLNLHNGNPSFCVFLSFKNLLDIIWN
jgi:hypothetical protein